AQQREQGFHPREHEVSPGCFGFVRGMVHSTILDVVAALREVFRAGRSRFPADQIIVRSGPDTAGGFYFALDGSSLISSFLMRSGVGPAKRRILPDFHGAPRS